MARKKQATTYRRGVYPSYLFKDHDPILDAVMTVIKDSGMSFSKIERDSGVSRSCLRNWDQRKTKRPQFATIKAVAKACGGELGIRYKNRFFEQ